jgi:hypothetical protein
LKKNHAHILVASHRRRGVQELSQEGFVQSVSLVATIQQYPVTPAAIRRRFYPAH